MSSVNTTKENIESTSLTKSKDGAGIKNTMDVSREVVIVGDLDKK